MALYIVLRYPVFFILMYLDYAVCFYTDVLYSVLLLAMMRHDHCDDCFTEFLNKLVFCSQISSVLELLVQLIVLFLAPKMLLYALQFNRFTHLWTKLVLMFMTLYRFY